MRRTLVNSLVRRFSFMKQPVSTGQKSKSDLGIYQPKGEDLLNQTMSLEEIKKKMQKPTDSSKINEMVKLEESLDLPYYLHGIQQVPEKKVA